MKNKISGGNITISRATGCLYTSNDCIYLVTNWHVLSGRHTQTKQTLDSKGGLPEIIRVHFPVDGNITEQITCEYKLTNDNKEYIWYEHPLSNEVDVAALKIQPPEGIATIPINEIIDPAPTYRKDFFYVTQDVWVIGFPMGIRISGLPIWKSATIASEPSISSASNKYKIILDTATREGMSGSPVLFVNKHLTRIKFDNVKHEVDLPSVKVMLGIYSGRIAGDDELAAQLGIVWSCECIPELIKAKRIYNN
ncbi:MAG: serine protease [Bacteroidetes bacterium]|nr:serine protease [Bacteroidota bacterium]